MDGNRNDRKSRVGTKSEGYNKKWMRKSGWPKLRTMFSAEGRSFINEHGKRYANLQKNAPTDKSMAAKDPHKYTPSEYWKRREATDRWAEQGGVRKTNATKKGGVVKK